MFHAGEPKAAKTNKRNNSWSPNEIDQIIAFSATLRKSIKIYAFQICGVRMTATSVNSTRRLCRKQAAKKFPKERQIAITSHQNKLASFSLWHNLANCERMKQTFNEVSVRKKHKMTENPENLLTIFTTRVLDATQKFLIANDFSRRLLN